jgi:hypothetical protein
MAACRRVRSKSSEFILRIWWAGVRISSGAPFSILGTAVTGPAAGFLETDPPQTSSENCIHGLNLMPGHGASPFSKPVVRNCAKRRATS